MVRRADRGTDCVPLSVMWEHGDDGNDENCDEVDEDDDDERFLRCSGSVVDARTIHVGVMRIQMDAAGASSGKDINRAEEEDDEGSSAERKRKTVVSAAVCTFMIAVGSVIAVAVLLTAGGGNSNDGRGGASFGAVSGPSGAQGYAGHGVRYYVPGSRCLDGSPMAMYVEASSQQRRWSIHLQGGGFCDSVSSCSERARTSLGTCRNDPLVGDRWDSLRYALLSPFASNPFRAYNKVLLRYCSGDMWSGAGNGTSSSSITQDTGTSTLSTDTTQTGAGAMNFDAAIAMLTDASLPFGLADAEVVILSGDSAGAAGVLYHLDALQRTLGWDTLVLGNSVGGLFPIQEEYTGPSSRVPEQRLTPASFTYYDRIWNARLHRGCLDSLGSTGTDGDDEGGSGGHEASGVADDAGVARQPRDCLLPQLLAPHVEAPVFYQEFITDSLVTTLYGGMPTVAGAPGDAGTGSVGGGIHVSRDWLSTAGDQSGARQPPSGVPEVDEFLTSYAEHSSRLLRSLADASGGPRNGVFAPSCFLHTNFDIDWPVVNGRTALDALYFWVNERAAGGGSGVHAYIDSCGGAPLWPPCNPTCPRGGVRR